MLPCVYSRFVPVGQSISAEGSTYTPVEQSLADSIADDRIAGIEGAVEWVRRANPPDGAYDYAAVNGEGHAIQLFMVLDIGEGPQIAGTASCD